MKFNQDLSQLTSRRQFLQLTGSVALAAALAQKAPAAESDAPYYLSIIRHVGSPCRSLHPTQTVLDTRLIEGALRSLVGRDNLQLTTHVPPRSGARTR